MKAKSRLLSCLAFVAMSLTTNQASAQYQSSMIGLITKTNDNPFFVKMKEGAEVETRRLGALLFSAAGKQDGDTATQIAAIERFVAAGIKTILITSNGDAILPAIKKAKTQGVYIIALDTPFDGADALFATDNYKAGVLIGQYAKAAMANKPAKIATIDLFPGHPVGAQRHNGFIKGFGLPAADANSTSLSSDPAVVCMADSYGDAEKGRAGMADCLAKHPDINLVYTINEPTAAGAYKALQKIGRERDVMIVSVDGGCAGIADIEQGRLLATSQQYPLRMAVKGVVAGVEYAQSGQKATGFFDTGVTLITANQLPGIDSRNVSIGSQLCWGKE